MNSSAQTMMLDVFMLLLIFFLIEPTGVQPTAPTDSYEKKIQQPNSAATINQGIKIKRLKLLVQKDAYYVHGKQMTIEQIKALLIDSKYAAIEVSSDHNALHRTVNRIEQIANHYHLRIFEVPT